MKKIDFLATDGILLNGLIYESQEKSKDVSLPFYSNISPTFIGFPRKKS